MKKSFSLSRIFKVASLLLDKRRAVSLEIGKDKKKE